MNAARAAIDRVVAPLRATASDRVVRNASWMYVNIGLSAVLGMVGWIIAARLYSPREVGAVAASVAAASFIVTVAALGLTETTIRHLHGVANQRRFVTRNLLLVSVSGLLGGVIWWALTHQLLRAQGIGPLTALG